MAVTVSEKWESRDSVRGDHPSLDLIYLIEGTDDDEVAQFYLLENTPLLRSGLVCQTRHVKRIGNAEWLGTVRYGRTSRENTASSFSFDTSGGTQHITQSLSTVGVWVPQGETPPAPTGAIGQTKDSVEGCDITVPMCKFSETHFVPVAYVTPAYTLTLFWLTGRMNQAPFRGLAAAECLFLGAQGSKRDEDYWEITYLFAGSPTLVNLAVGELNGIIKRGWDYLWVRYANTVDANLLIKKPVAVYVEQVYQFGDFYLLGIGA